MMMRLLVLLFIVIPALEIWAIIEVGQRIGGWQTFGLIILTGIVGAYLAKKEALKVWNYAQHDMASGQIPTRHILDGICVFAGGIFLLSPGFLTDIAGILLILPVTRRLFRNVLSIWIQKRLSNGRPFFYFRR
ncbi:FxsA family protein [Paenibacillus mesophilus]|uniref:FxsA family protein n=1 Tax=Paenibacillus mesophilus TaxID=2582849 RepID=UPI001EE4EAC7|nr:FxsA family protein [Paenibacillus mesophilus]